MSQFMELLKKRRSVYAIEAASTLTDDQLASLVSDATRNAPSPYNMQCAKTVLLLGEHHRKFWDMVLELLRERVDPEKFAPTENKNRSFAAGYGTILFFNDQELLQNSIKKAPSFSDSFETWAQHSNAMLQFALWNLLTEAGMGASLQHYNPIVDSSVHSQWNLPENYQLIAQMPFGRIVSPADEKQFNAMKDRFYRFG